MIYHINVEEIVIRDFTGPIFAATANRSVSLNSSVSDFQREDSSKLVLCINWKKINRRNKKFHLVKQQDDE